MTAWDFSQLIRRDASRGAGLLGARDSHCGPLDRSLEWPIMRNRVKAHIQWGVAAAWAAAFAATPVAYPATETQPGSPAVKQAPTELEIKAAEAVLELADPAPQVRERAARRLMDMGRDAQGVLERAAQSADPEISVRSREILLDFRYGLYPETPADVAAL